MKKVISARFMAPYTADFSGNLMTTQVGVACTTPDLRTPLYNGQTFGPNGGRFRGVPLYTNEPILHHWCGVGTQSPINLDPTRLLVLSIRLTFLPFLPPQPKPGPHFTAMYAGAMRDKATYSKSH